ncbi:bifunctional hydroxymethylpyrimidine kinase/phosphomethylpyrimidine kinase [Candidatus Anaplasma sp. TIGMIC]|uniref:bifunctional hydroxymethylpyrimidine kinase/phosphomethylpyrimidine kinase n=1 Tax=Candidatus Anaplasma sp. TIGMIC TaxID=3020713 RepID=UPI002FE3032E
MYKGKVLSIAGSDSSGGAGVQADIKTITMLGCYAAACITSVTAQNTQGVFGTWDLAAEVLEKQIVCVLEDIEIDAIKIGMLPAQLIGVVSNCIPHGIPVILDPVMVSTSGYELTDSVSFASCIPSIAEKVMLITPNFDEAKVLSGLDCIHTENDMVDAALSISSRFGIKSVLVKGKILQKEDYIKSVLLTENGVFWFQNLRFPEVLHGTGCTLTAAIASFVAQNVCIEKSVGLAFDYVASTIKNVPRVGCGFNPVFHNHSIACCETV